MRTGLLFVTAMLFGFGLIGPVVAEPIQLPFDVLDKDGHLYENVRINVDSAHQVVSILIAGLKKDVPFSEIDAIYAPNGRNVAENLLGQNYRPSSPKAYMSEGAVKLRLDRYWRFRAVLLGSYDMAIDDYYEDFKSGAGFGGGIQLSLSPEVGIKLQHLRIGAKYSEKVDIFQSIEPGLELINETLEISMSATLIGIDVYKPMSAVTNPSCFIFYGAGLGGIRNAILYTADEVAVTGGYSLRREVEDSDWDFAMYLEGGLLAELGGDFYLDIALSFIGAFAKGLYRNTITGEISEEYGMQGEQFAARFGLSKTFGKWSWRKR